MDSRQDDLKHVVTVVSEEMPVSEKLLIKKFVLGNGKGPRICIETGIHGDELEGQYVCFEMARRLSRNLDKINGTVEIWPAINPLGVDSVSRGIPTFDLDMNRTFPGQLGGHMVEKVAHDVVADLAGADLVVDIHSSNVFLYEMPQARISQSTAEKLVPYAQMLNLDFIWVHEAATVLQSTIAHSLNSIGTPTLVVEMGIGMRITQEYGNRLVAGLFNLLKKIGVWTGQADRALSVPELSTDGEVEMINAPASGVVVNVARHSDRVKKGQLLCQIVSSLTGDVLADVCAPADGLLFTMRGYPIVYEGSLLARIFRKIK
ncbi:MAG: succinylglutamate desuccinylase/aspartoacylase family protein [Marinilabiliaceae bacterium]